jgi:hypothetical protein
LGTYTALHAELTVAMLFVEIGYDRGWFNLWFECDFVITGRAFDNFLLVPW